MAVPTLKLFPRHYPPLDVRLALQSVRPTSWMMPTQRTSLPRFLVALINGCGLSKPIPKRHTEDSNLLSWHPRTRIRNSMNSKSLTKQDFLVIHQSTVLLAGTAAPDFTLRSTPDETVTLSDFRGHPVILFFYPSDWSPVCGDQAALY